MEKMSTELATNFIEAICGGNGDFFISEYAQKVMKGSPSLSTIPTDRKYVVLSIERDLGGSTIHGYDNLRQKVIDAGFIPLESPNEAVRYALEHWNELQEAGFRFLSSSAPSVQVDDWHRFVCAYLDYSFPYLRSCGVDYDFCPDVAVLAFSAN